MSRSDMDQPRKYMLGVESKIFDPRDASTSSSGAELLDATASKRGERWWMYLAGQVGGFGATDIYSASLPSGAQLAATGWKLTRSATGSVRIRFRVPTPHLQRTRVLADLPAPPHPIANSPIVHGPHRFSAPPA